MLLAGSLVLPQMAQMTQLNAARGKRVTAEGLRARRNAREPQRPSLLRRDKLRAQRMLLAGSLILPQMAQKTQMNVAPGMRVTAEVPTARRNAREPQRPSLLRRDKLRAQRMPLAGSLVLPQMAQMTQMNACWGCWPFAVGYWPFANDHSPFTSAERPCERAGSRNAVATDKHGSARMNAQGPSATSATSVDDRMRTASCGHRSADQCAMESARCCRVARTSS